MLKFQYEYGKYKTEYIIHYNSNWNPTYEIYSDKEIYTCSFQGTREPS